MRIKKFFSKLFVGIAALFLVTTAVVLVVEANHDCTHEDCQICEVIREVQENSKKVVKDPPVKVVSLIVPSIFLFVACISYIEKEKEVGTPVSLKIKMLN